MLVPCNVIYGFYDMHDDCCLIFRQCQKASRTVAFCRLFSRVRIDYDSLLALARAMVGRRHSLSAGTAYDIPHFRLAASFAWGGPASPISFVFARDDITRRRKFISKLGAFILDVMPGGGAGGLT